MDDGKPAHPPIGDPSFDSIVLQHFAAILRKSRAEIAAEQKAFDEQAPCLRDSIKAEEQVIASIYGEISILQKRLMKSQLELDVKKQKIQSLSSKLDALKARDPFQKFHHALLQLGSKPTATQQPASGPGDDATCEPRPNKRRRTAGEDKHPERTVDFDTVFGNGKPTHVIVEHPKKSRNWYILECQQHEQRFDNTRYPLISAMQHIRGKLHELEMNADTVIRELGTRVVGCDENKVKRNNDAFTPITTPQARQPRLSEVYRPKPGKLYLGPWGTRGNKTWYAVVVLPHDDLEPIGMDGTLRDTGLLSGTVPPCYEVRDQKIVGWEKGYEDDGVAVASRKFPLLWLQDNVTFTFKDGRLQVPTQQCFSWLPAAKLRPFHGSGPDGKPVMVPESVRLFFQRPPPNQAPLANMDPLTSAGDIDEGVEDGQESDKDYVDVPDQESDDDSDDEWDIGPEEAAMARSDIAGQPSASNRLSPRPIDPTGQPSIAANTPKPPNPEKRQTQPPQTEGPPSPPKDVGSIHGLSQNLGPGPVSNPAVSMSETSSNNAPPPPVERTLSNTASQSPCTPKSPPARPPPGPTPLQFTASQAQQTMYHRLGLNPNSPQPVESMAAQFQRLQKQGQLSPGMDLYYNEMRSCMAQTQAHAQKLPPQPEKSTMDTERHFGTMHPGPNQMAWHEKPRRSYK